MKKIFKQKFTTILLALAFLVGAVSTVNFALKTEAASQAVGDLTVEFPGSGPLFNASNIAPGYEETRTITITNNGTVNHSFSIALSGAVGELANALQFEPRILPSNFPIWNHSLAEIAASADGFVVLPTILPHQTIQFNLAAILPSNVGNAYQGKSVQTFGIIMGSDSSYTDNPDIIPVFGDGSTTSSTITGTGGQPPLTYPRVRGLALGTEGVGQGTPVVAENPPATQGEVLGTTSETKGEETSNKNICFWWWVLSIVYAVLLAIYGWIFYKRELIFDWLWPILGGTALYFLHWYLHNFYTPSKWCPYFVWFELVILILYYIIYSHYKNRAEEKAE